MTTQGTNEAKSAVLWKAECSCCRNWRLVADNKRVYVTNGTIRNMVQESNGTITLKEIVPTPEHVREAVYGMEDKLLELCK